MKRFFLTIIVPALLAISLFVGVIYIVIIPGFENAILDRKKEMLMELTNTAWSLVHEYDEESERGLITVDEAKALAAEKVGRMRYGEEGKDYFWITDMRPYMVMHPYRSELNNTDLTGYRDQGGNRLFEEAVAVVTTSGEGFVDYIWQWKDDSLKIVPKLSFVKGYEKWNWVIGTGIYLNDVSAEIAALEKNLLTITSVIIVLIFLIIFYIVRGSLSIERKRSAAEISLKFSRRKYKSLVEASTEGTVMFVEEKVIFANQRFRMMAGDNVTGFTGLSRRDLFDADWESLDRRLTGGDKSVTLEATLKVPGSIGREVVLSVSGVSQDSKPGYIIIVKEAGAKSSPPPDLLGLSEDVQASVLLMGQPVKPLAGTPVYIGMNKTAAEASLIIRSRKCGSLFVRSGDETVGIVTALDIVERVVAPGLSATTPVSRIMTSPVLTISESATIFEAIHYMQQNRIANTGITDSAGAVSGVINISDLREAQDNSLTFVARRAAMATSVPELKNIYNSVPIIVTAFLEGGGNIGSLLQVITAITDAITRQVIALAVSEMGEPPAQFVFLALGSEGRGEQTLYTDQDNAIIFVDEIAGDTEKRRWFLELGKRINADLASIGFSLCEGNVMAGNPQWNCSLKEWKDHFEGWMTHSDPVAILDASIFFDFRGISGDDSLVDELRSFVRDMALIPGQFQYHMAASVTSFRIPSISGGGNSDGASGDNEDVDIKRAITPVVSYARLMAITSGVTSTNTVLRLRESLREGGIGEESFKEITYSYNLLMQLRLRSQASAMISGRAPSNRIDIAALNSIERGTLRKVLTIIVNMQSVVASRFRVT